LANFSLQSRTAALCWRMVFGGHRTAPAQTKGNMSSCTDSPGGPGVSRRGFLKGIGVGTAATGLLTAVKPIADAAQNESGFVGPGEFSLTLQVNGQSRPLKVEPRVTLLDALRNRLDITGPKKVCDRGTCGACTVLLDGKPVYACSMLAVEAQGRAITTVEGLGTPEKMNAVQAAFVKHDAQQCGFCTPGFVTAATAFVRNNPNASVEQIRAGLGGNLCRCGTYAGMLLAVADAAKKGAA
jgi:xanthine dehydrogenase YagT iron-sulfur-binding subunit